MQQTIEIEVPDGKKTVCKNNQILSENIKIQLPKTWEEFCKISNISEKEYYISSYDGAIKVHCIRSYPVRRSHKSDYNVLPTKEEAEQHIAYMKLHQLRNFYRNGWKPEWADNTKKYCIKHRKYCNGKNSYYIATNTDTHLIEFLSFQTKSIAELFLTNFEDLIKQAGDLV